MKPLSIEDIQETVRSEARITPRGRGSKPSLIDTRDGAVVVDMSSMSGILEYQPDEYTFTALAGTPLAEIQELLRQNRQYLPFDPPLVAAGATLGGTLAAGLSSAGRYRYGGVRDFVLGVLFVDGQGQTVRAGGRVVKNAAGFDLPKLMVGSMGQYGILVELSFKVFPSPQAYATLLVDYDSLQEALDDLIQLTREPLEIAALDILPGVTSTRLLVRIGGNPESFAGRDGRLRSLLTSQKVEFIREDADEDFWRAEREFTWVPESSALVKVPVTPRLLPRIEKELASRSVVRRYSVGANLAWLAWREPVEILDALLRTLDLSGLVLFGTQEYPQLGSQTQNEFSRRLKLALDPLGKFPGSPVHARQKT